MPMVTIGFERNYFGQFKKGYKHPMKDHTTRLNTCPCGVKFVCVTHPKKRGRPVYQKVKYHSDECREIYGKRGGVK